MTTKRGVYTFSKKKKKKEKKKRKEKERCIYAWASRITANVISLLKEM